MVVVINGSTAGTARRTSSSTARSSPSVRTTSVRCGGSVPRNTAAIGPSPSVRYLPFLTTPTTWLVVFSPLSANR